jgi:hypothetical protein
VSDQKPTTFDIDSIGHDRVSNTKPGMKSLRALTANHLGPDFKKAREMAYATRRYLEIELTQYEDVTCDQ